MEAWVSIVLRQLILYSLPLLVSLTLVAWLEARACGRSLPHAFHAIAWKGTWLPLLASIAMQRGVVVALSNPVQAGVKSAAVRLGVHLLLALIGWLLYSYSLAMRAPTGVPPLHHWWAKVMMYFNLCMAALHLLPLPNQLTAALLARYIRPGTWTGLLPAWGWLTLVAATPLLDWLLGGVAIYPLYEQLANAAANLHR